jgi:hypothetical protein
MRAVPPSNKTDRTRTVAIHPYHVAVTTNGLTGTGTTPFALELRKTQSNEVLEMCD